MSGYFLHTKVLKLVFSFSLDTFISFNEHFLTFSICLFFFSLNKTRKSLSRKKCPAGTDHTAALSPRCRNLVQRRESGDLKSCPSTHQLCNNEQSKTSRGLVSPPLNQAGVNCMLLKVPCDPTGTPPSLKVYEEHARQLEKPIQKGIRTQPPMTQKAMGGKKKKSQSVPIKCPGKSLQ